MRLESSWIVMNSGIVTSRTSFSFDSLPKSFMRRLMRRANEGFECSRTSSGRSAVVTVRRARRLSCTTRFGLAETLLGDLVGLALGLVVVTAAIVFLALAGFGSLTLDALDRVALGADLRVFLGDLAFFGLPQAGIGECMRAGTPLLLGQRPQHHPGWLSWRG